VLTREARLARSFGGGALSGALLFGGGAIGFAPCRRGLGERPADRRFSHRHYRFLTRRRDRDRRCFRLGLHLRHERNGPGFGADRRGLYFDDAQRRGRRDMWPRRLDHCDALPRLRRRRLSAPCEIGLKGGEAAFLRDANGRDCGERDHQPPDHCDKRGEDRANIGQHLTALAMPAPSDSRRVGTSRAPLPRRHA